MSRVVIHEAAMKRFLQTREGPVGRFVQKKAGEIHSGAIANIEANLDERTGDLLTSLRQIPFDRDDVPHIAVGADAVHRRYPYARALETGINPWDGSAASHGKHAYMVPAVIAAGFIPRS